jgi:hypothetical protein
MSERHAGQVEQAIAAPRLGPVRNAHDLVVADEHLGYLEIAVDEHLPAFSQCDQGQELLGASHARRSSGQVRRERTFATVPDHRQGPPAVGAAGPGLTVGVTFPSEAATTHRAVSATTGSASSVKRSARSRACWGRAVGAA